jgi:carboxylate-amine ligase
VRPSVRYPTIEVRICDVPLRVEDTVTLGGLVRALVWTARRDALDRVPVADPSTEALESATWRAARYGLHGNLVLPLARRVAPAADVVGMLLDHVRDGLEVHGDLDQVSLGLRRLEREGTGSELQRKAFERQGSLADVVTLIRASTSG